MKKYYLPILVSGLLVAASSGFASSEQEESNKQVVTQFYQKAINERDFAAARPYMGAWYIQHNPQAQDGIEGFRQFLEFMKATYPQAHSEIKRVIAEGDYVTLHVHSVKQPGELGQAIVDIFRLENNKIVEHWDVIQSIPEQSANGNGMF